MPDIPPGHLLDFFFFYFALGVGSLRASEREEWQEPLTRKHSSRVSHNYGSNTILKTRISDDPARPNVTINSIYSAPGLVGCFFCSRVQIGDLSFLINLFHGWRKSENKLSLVWKKYGNLDLFFSAKAMWRILKISSADLYLLSLHKRISWSEIKWTRKLSPDDFVFAVTVCDF